MAEPFATVDLRPCANAGRGNVDTGSGWLWPAVADDPDNTVLKRLPAGACKFWGIPFALAGEEADPAFVVVAGGALENVPEQVVIPVGQKAHRVLFAHVCAPIQGEYSTLEGTGESIATYRVVFEDGSVVEQELRRRFEIHDATIPWGHHPFLCRNCREFRSVELGDRTLPYGMAQVGVKTDYGGDLDGWWLFDWENPSPDKAIREIAVVATGATALALGAITLCHEQGDPLNWPPREEVALTVEGDEDGVAAVEVEMERGEVVRQDMLFVPREDFLTTDEAGWGRGGYEKRGGRYLEIHGSREGALQVKSEDGKTERFRWGDVLEEKKLQRGGMRLEMVSPGGKEWVHVRVEDGDSGKPVGSRIHFRSSQGAYFAPHGHQADVNVAWFEDMGGDCKVLGTPYAYIDGTCQIELPVGQVFVEVVRGFEYAPVRRQLEIKPGQRHLTLKLEREFDMKQRGFYSGDTHVHFLTAQSSRLEAEAEDVNVVHLLASQWGRLFTSWEEFSGGLAPTSSTDHLIWVSQENRQHVLGHISLLGLKEMVAPICTGGPQEDWVGGEIQTLMADWAESCRSQNGLVIMPHMPVPDFENAADIVLGHADAAEMCWIWLGEEIGQGERGYYRWLNVGQKLPIVGGTDKMSNGRILAGSRTYVKLRPDEEFTFASWCQAVRRGTTFASTGAFIDLKVEGREMGEEIHLPGNGGRVEVEAVAESVWPLSAVELIVNGVSVAREEAAGARRIEISYKLKAARSCWVAARCWGPYMTDAGPVMAHSSPVYIDVGRRCAFEPSEGQYLMTHMEGGISWAERIGVFRDEAVRARLIALFREAKDELKRRSLF
ncbi:MAG: hypothetical protein CME16_03070 [Gemmatimonadetes bacterium]|nr:hypothetical protein [Gemmatimonadota bacterium]